MSIYNEANFQWFQSDFIGAKFVPEDISITELAGVQNYYQFRMKLRQYTPISATAQNYNL